MFKKSSIGLITALLATGLLAGCGADGSVTTASASSSTTVTVPATPAPAVTAPTPTPTPVVAPRPVVKVRTIWVEPATSYDNYNVADGGNVGAYQQKIRVDVPSGPYLGTMWICVKDEGSNSAPVTVYSSGYDGGFITNGGGGIGAVLVNGKGRVSIDTAGFFNQPVVPEFFVAIYANVAHGAPLTTVRLVVDPTNPDCGNTGIKFFGTAVDQDTVLKPSETATFKPTSTPPSNGGKG